MSADVQRVNLNREERNLKLLLMNSAKISLVNLLSIKVLNNAKRVILA